MPNRSAQAARATLCRATGVATRKNHRGKQSTSAFALSNKQKHFKERGVATIHQLQVLSLRKTEQINTKGKRNFNR